MKIFATVSITFLLLLGISAPSGAKMLTRSYTNNTLGTTFATNIILKGELLHIAKFKYWLNEICRIPAGRKTLQAIVDSGHTLTIENNKVARISAGRTRAPATEDLINGVGADVEILFDGSVTEAGSHRVYDSHGQLIEYTPAENLFHELVHAKHKMLGTWRYFNSEGQAIEEENVFRQQSAAINHLAITRRGDISGVPIETVVDLSTLPAHHYQVRCNPPLAQ